MVLLYLQQEYREWIERKSLQRLQIHRNGTFVLSSSSSNKSVSATQAEAVNDDNNNEEEIEEKSRVRNRSTTTSTPTATIWTCYDELEKKHLLYFYSDKHHVQYPFLLKDNTMPAASQRQTQEEQVQLSVREMIQLVDKLSGCEAKTTTNKETTD
ncbi:hypothetical protein ACA910_016231 [Epithemia clementina (nom. ined.)]